MSYGQDSNITLGFKFVELFYVRVLYVLFGDISATKPATDIIFNVYRRTLATILCLNQTHGPQ